MPGIAGALQIDPASASVPSFATVVVPAGIADVAVAIPPQPALAGFELWAQGLVLGATPAFTAAVHEQILAP